MAKKPGTRHRSIDQQVAEAEERLNKLRKRQRERDTRRKILAGAFYIKQAERNSEANKQLMSDMDSWLTDERDRRLFELGAMQGLFGAKLSPAQPGWSLGVTLSQTSTDRYGNAV